MLINDVLSTSEFIFSGTRREKSTEGSRLQNGGDVFQNIYRTRMLKSRGTCVNITEARNAQKVAGTALRHFVLHWKLETAGR